MNDKIHKFELAGLGKAPFRFVRAGELVFQPYPGAPYRAGGSCDYCGTAIRNAFYIQSSDGKEFKVGCECVNKTGDSGLIKQAKKAKRVRDRELRIKRALKKTQAFQNWLEENKKDLAKIPHPNDYFSVQGKTLVDYFEYIRPGGYKAEKLQKHYSKILEEN